MVHVLSQQLKEVSPSLCDSWNSSVHGKLRKEQRVRLCRKHETIMLHRLYRKHKVLYVLNRKF